MNARPLRVATLITRLEGGAGVLALRGARALDPGAFQVTIITGHGNRLLDQAAEAGLEVVVEPTLRMPIDPRNDLRALRALDALLRRGQFDVAHTHTAKAGTLGRIAASRASVPRIVHTYHGFPFHEFQSRGRRSAYVAIERRLGRLTDVALCVGTGVAVEAVRRGLIAPERVRTIRVAVDSPPGTELPVRTPQARQKARRALGLPAGVAVVGAVGRLTYQKAPEDFLAALRRLNRPDVIGVWVGGGELAARVDRLAAMPTAARVILAGERADVLDILPAFDVFALPSRYEGLPTAVVEAMLCGIPVVATAVNAVSDVVVPGETGLLVPPRRPDLLADAVRYLLDRPAVAARMADAARARLGDRFGEQALRDALMAAYELLPGRTGDQLPGRPLRADRGPVRGPGPAPHRAGPVAALVEDLDPVGRRHEHLRRGRHLPRHHTLKRPPWPSAPRERGVDVLADRLVLQGEHDGDGQIALDGDLPGVVLRDGGHGGRPLSGWCCQGSAARWRGGAAPRGPRQRAGPAGVR
jgi:glycosyltransferase involved in cell wall biosynthesis